MADPRDQHEATAARIDPSSWDELPVGLFSFDRSGRIISYNEAFIVLLGLSVHDYPSFERCTSVQLNLSEAAERVLSGETVRLAGWHHRSNEQARFLRTTMSPSFQNDRVTGGVGVLEDATEQRRYEERMEQLSSLDPLTELYNRKKVSDLLMAVAERPDASTDAAVIMLDIDYFKLVNDTFGHPTGDLVLRSIAQLLRRNIRKTDAIGRWGGEEFLIVAPHSSLADGVRLADKLRQTVNDEPFGPVPHVTCSFGVSSFAGGKSVEQVLQDTDEALYAAKHHGRNQVSSKQ